MTILITRCTAMLVCAVPIALSLSLAYGTETAPSTFGKTADAIAKRVIAAGTRLTATLDAFAATEIPDTERATVADSGYAQIAAQATKTPVALNDPTRQRIELHRNGAAGTQVAVTVGIPFAPGMLRDARDVRIVDERGEEIPAHVEPTLNWHSPNGTIRAVRVQFRTTLEGKTRTVHFVTGTPRQQDAAGWPYADGLVKGSDGVLVPGVLAGLSPQWMSASLIAGPQLPAAANEPYAAYVATQFKWAEPMPVDDSAAWLFDRPSTLFQQYVRTGRIDYLAAAVSSYRFYMSHLRRDSAPGWPKCGGGWHFKKAEACDPKYVYIEPILLALGLTGDDSEHDATLIQRMVGAWDTGGWNVPAGPYSKPDMWFTEREAGLGLLALSSAYEITGSARYLNDVKRRVGWLLDHQRNNPDKLGDDGSWRSSWQKHEGDTYDAATDVRGSSPWMSENIIDGLWHGWLATGDTRIPPMITAFGRYLERYGWIDPKLLGNHEHDWRNPCSGPTGQISWYWSSALANSKQLTAIQDSEGWYSDAHNVELMLPVAVARYFETDPTQRRKLDDRMALLASSYNQACADNEKTARRFNWNNRGVGVVQWLVHEPKPSAPASTAVTTAADRTP